MNSGEVLLEVVRNDLVESIHSGHLLILDSDGREVLALGELDQLIYPPQLLNLCSALRC